MSVCYKLSHLQSNNKVQIKKISKNLTVSPDSKEKSDNFFQNKGHFQKHIQVEAFTFDDNDNIYLPFSYSYHFLPKSTIVSHTKTSMTFSGKLLDRQKDIRDEAFEILNRTKSLLLCLHTGFGKTIFALYIASKINLKTIVLCHRKIIMDQWIESIEKYLPGTSVSIWTPKLKKLPDILIANVLSINKWSRDQYKEYGLVIADEIHTMCTEQMIKGFTHLTPEYLIGLSATPFRTDGMDRLIELYVGPEIIFRKMTKIFNVYRLNTEFTPNVEYTVDGTLNWNSVIESQSFDDDRNNLICDIIRIFENRNILVLVKRVEHAHILFNKLKSYNQDVDMFLGSDKSVNYECRILIATYSKGGVGFDNPKLNMLITASDVEENFMQYIGRIFRKDDVSPIYIDLIDNNSIIKKHASTRKKISIEIGGHIRDFNKSFPDFNTYRKTLN